MLHEMFTDVAMVTQKKNPFIKVGANTAEDTLPTAYTWSHRKWWHGNTIVSPARGPSAGISSSSLHPPEQESVEV